MVLLIHRIVPYETTDENGFNNNNIKITVEDLQTAINSTKQRAPGLTGITRRHLIEAPRKTFQQLLNIFNSCLNLGYFPDTFKILKLIFLKTKNKQKRQKPHYLS